MESIEAEEKLKSRRPAIPADVAREILIEAGHRCAVCGAECPLERAHIIPWRECKEHTVDNLICLCANCHARADSEGWGQQTLQEYKSRPWILRHRPTYSGPMFPTSRLQLVVDMEIERFDERYRRFLQHAVASFLGTDPDSVEVIEIKEGSVRITIDVPSNAIAKRLLRSGFGLREYLEPLRLVDIEFSAAHPLDDDDPEPAMLAMSEPFAFDEEETPEEFDDLALPVESDFDWRKD